VDGRLTAGLLVAVLAIPIGVRAQSSASVGVGYSFLHELEGSQGTGGVSYPAGWLADVAIAPRASSLSLVGEVGGVYRKPAGVLQNLYGFLGGVRFSFRRSTGLVPFGQVLAGLERYSEPGFVESGFAIQTGGGVELPISAGLTARAQVDFRVAHEQGQTFKEFRIGGAVAIKLW
jgi:hypothetical protein